MFTTAPAPTGSPDDHPSPTTGTPLGQVERAVQDRAKTIDLDLAGPDGEAHLRRLIDDEIGRWQDDHKRGGRSHALIDPAGIAERAFRNIARYGPLTALLADDDVWEIMINSPSDIFVKRHHGLGGYHDEVFEDDDHVIRTLTKILDDSSSSHRKLDPTEGLQDAQLDTGARLHIVHGDLARGGHVMVNIRKFTGVAFTTLDQLVERDMMTAEVARFLAACVRARASIVFAGAPGSGKTTMLSCCAGELDPSLRVVTAEEVFEADIPVANVAAMQTRAPRADRPGIDLRRLVSGFLRMAPDIAIVGEVRDREALWRRRYPRCVRLTSTRIAHWLTFDRRGLSSISLVPVGATEGRRTQCSWEFRPLAMPCPTGSYRMILRDLANNLADAAIQDQC